MRRKFHTHYYFNCCPITAWNREKNLEFHNTLVKMCKKLAKTYRALEFGDFYNSAIEGYLLFLLRHPVTIDNNNFGLALTYAKGGIKRLLTETYGRKDSPKGRAMRSANFIPLNGANGNEN